MGLKVWGLGFGRLGAEGLGFRVKEFKVLEYK